jgi:hypothetical protein
MTSVVLSLLASLCMLGPEPDWQAEIDRLVGHKVEVSSDGYHILDIAGEGEPLVGCVRREGKDLYLESGDSRWRLTGPLAVPRIAGPNYKVWVVGNPTVAKTLPVKRLGILATPDRSLCGLR